MKDVYTYGKNIRPSDQHGDSIQEQWLVFNTNWKSFTDIELWNSKIMTEITNLFSTSKRFINSKSRILYFIRSSTYKANQLELFKASRMASEPNLHQLTWCLDFLSKAQIHFPWFHYENVVVTMHNIFPRFQHGLVIMTSVEKVTL